MTLRFEVAILTTKLIDFIAKDGAKDFATVLAGLCSAIVAPVCSRMAGNERCSAFNAIAFKAVILCNAGHLLFARLSFHVAGLAQADQIIDAIRLFCSAKQAIRFDVVYWQALANIPSTINADAVLLLYHNKAQRTPVATTIAVRATDPERRVCARFVFVPITIATLTGTVLTCECRIVSLPRLAHNIVTAVFALSNHDGFDPLGIVAASNLFGFEPRRVAGCLFSRGIQLGNAKTCYATTGTEPRFFASVEGYVILFAAHFTTLGNTIFRAHRFNYSREWAKRQVSGTGTVAHDRIGRSQPLLLAVTP